MQCGTFTPKFQAADDSCTDLVGEERTGFGCISKEFLLLSNISITLLIVGLSFGNV